MSQPTDKDLAAPLRKTCDSRSHPSPSDYYYHYPHPRYPRPIYIGPPMDNGPKQTPRSENGVAAFYRHQYDVDAFTPNPPTCARSHRTVSTPPKITPQDWIPDGLSTQRSPCFGSSDPPAVVTGSSSSESTESIQNRPVPARSAFFCFMQAKRGDNTNEAAEAWRLASKEERAHWENVADDDRKRYNKEREEFSNPTARKLRKKKDPSAPKRPMSAFLMYAQNKRRQLQRENPDIPNADISRLLGEAWRSASLEEKAPFLHREEIERNVYKAKMERWKCDQKYMKSIAPKVYLAKQVASATRSERYDRRQDEVPVASGEESNRYAPPPNINEFGALYPVEATYHYPSHGYHDISSPAKEKVVVVGGYWEDSLKHHPFDFGTTYSYPRPEEEKQK